MVLAVRDLARDLGEPARATVGTLGVRPNQPNIVAESVAFIVDLRHPDRATQERMVATVQERCRAIAATTPGVTVTSGVLVDQPPTPMDPALLALVERLARERGWSHRRMTSGPGHDAMILGRRVPTVMLFVPSRDGRSHSPAEFTPHEQLMPGVQLLADAVEALATGAA
jgi:acetylornithine deacetylase/succinyl-diaminopimelate desuccinylase-like protein